MLGGLLLSHQALGLLDHLAHRIPPAAPISQSKQVVTIRRERAFPRSCRQ
jgi:hypothetical protein